MEITASTVGKGVAAVCGSGAGGYGIYALATGEKTLDSSTEAAEGEAQSTGETQQNLLVTEIDSTSDFIFQTKNFGQSTNEYTKDQNTFGYAFGRFMLNPDKNGTTWTKNVEKLKKEISSLDGFFESLKSETEVNEKLRQKCKEIYKKPKSDVISSINGIWSYCSINAVETPKTVETSELEKDRYKGKWARESKNSEALLGAPTQDKYEDFWNHIYDNFLSKDKLNSNKKNLINSKFLSLNSSSDLNSACSEAYDSDSRSDDINHYGENVREYCILDASISLSNYPTAPGGS